jgi:hypothetical protein
MRQAELGKPMEVSTVSCRLGTYAPGQARVDSLADYERLRFSAGCGGLVANQKRSADNKTKIRNRDSYIRRLRLDAFINQYHDH